MKLEVLFREISGEKRLAGVHSPDVEIGEIVYDSRNVSSCRVGVLFACARGSRVDGHDFAASAIDSGAVALLAERELSFDDAGSKGVPQIIVPDVRAAMGEAASVLYGRPSDKLTMIGLTGTNGKTTTAYITRSIIRASGRVCGMLGTVVYDDCSSEEAASRTTPEGPDIQRSLCSMVRNGATCCVMEASSHGLAQGRLEGCSFDRVAFGNLTFEHLEYHGDMENYFAAKRLLFSNHVKRDWAAVINADDDYGVRLLAEYSGSAFGFSIRREPERGLYCCVGVRTSIEGTELDVTYPDGESQSIRSPLIGFHNAQNVMEAIALADSLSIPRDVIHKGILECRRVPGRLERYALARGAAAFVDYAHSPDGLEKVLSTLSALKTGRLWVLWGAGGDRTAAKRPLAGAVMARLADRVIITTDNPRSERPADIASQVESGVISSGEGIPCEIILDRGEAIRSALDRAESGDVVLVAGKGPENYIEYADSRVPFSDTGIVLEWIEERGLWGDQT
ncbi:MAG: UDP-N-acetylmuramoyl-L-alanyl-D-glutamate--2,6-diaminopimelate ligase [Synergistaceae bacterium]|nr:UDP-N-acetylmuramoyl-L-alanyl-D-glutamate--2,6-diaminopimelate ligase [Synergistaceae bacterium]